MAALAGALFLTMHAAYGQQDPMYTQYMENLLMVNPAYAGYAEVLDLTLVSRNQWVNIDGAPKTQTLSLHTPFSRYNMGIGLSLLHDKIGVTEQTGLYADYSYRLIMGLDRVLAFGLKAGVNFYQAGLTDLVTVQPGDPVFAYDVNRSFLPNFGVGAFYYSDKFYAGLAVPKIIRNVINREGVATEHLSREEIHVFFMSGMVININRSVKFKPCFLTKFVNGAPLTFDLTGQFIFYDRLRVGALYRMNDSFGGMVQMQVSPNLRIGYSYDLTTTRLGMFNNGTHEVMVGYNFNFGGDRVRSPRYF